MWNIQVGGSLQTKTVDRRLVDQFASASFGLTIYLSLFLFFLGMAMTAGFTLAGGVKNPNGLFVALAASSSLGFAMLIAMALEAFRCRKRWKEIKNTPGITYTTTPATPAPPT